MARAVSLARTPDVRTHPNPQVGAVLLDATGAEIGSGFHRGVDHSHAEIEALAQAGHLARGATAVVTLEPCNHTGRTGPCSEALINAGVVRAVYGQPDPNPLARGGADALAAAGIDVEGGVLAEEARSLNPVWSFAMERQRPLVTWKFAATLDGRVAAADKTSRWISSAESRAEVHRIRAEVDAVVIGTGTVLADDPHLTVRDERGVLLSRQPLRVVVGERRLPTAARVLDSAAPTLVAETRDVSVVLDTLFARDVHHVLLEGGPTLAAAFLRADLTDRVIGYVGPRLLGSGPALVGALDVDTISDAVELTIDDVCLVGGDIRWTARLHGSAPLFINPDPATTDTERAD
ncbi:MAG: bifunctional diaminohydroxyphosphoribosylaminopyrimidine deaminase/5-amino-6-(5-phosphoribosylamino)uracil reductase RibD [Actinomycetia bacterium]|nr:bifunctional diaminohydroxyphosphoribosylaminopyrimidine deaminase/5-amino-6-(5-phosphoribosylamino)uracil reductase RibD [Actinomycetes bacterium]